MTDSARASAGGLPSGAVLMFAAMAATYGLGVFNDQFFKQAACLLAVGAGRGELQGYAAALMALPFVVLAAPAGWCADRFPKRRVIIVAKALEVVAMAAGAVGLYYLSWPFVLLMVFIMGVQSTLFSPALNGAIPECFPPERVLPVNGLLKMATTAAMLAGIVLAGLTLGLGADATVPAGPETASGTAATAATATVAGRIVTGWVAVGVALAGFLASWAIPGRAAANPSVAFPWKGPAETWAELRRCMEDRFLWRVMKLDAFIWAVAAAQTLWINEIGLGVLGLGERETSLLVMAELGGLVVGGGLAGRLGAGERWRGLLGWAALAAGTGGFGTALATLWAPSAGATWTAAALLALMGAGGGMFLVPLESCVQTRPEADRKGRVIAANNALAFLAIMLAGVALGLGGRFGFGARGGFVLLGAALIGVGLWCLRSMKRPE